MNRWSAFCAGILLGTVLGGTCRLRAEVSPESAPSAGPSGRVAIVQDESRQIATALQSLFEKRGFGASIISWDDLANHRLRAGELDLVVLADARRLPTAAVENTVALLRSRGKLLSIGAPAFGQRLIKTPGGYVASDRYNEAIYDSLARRPISLAAGGWNRACRYPKRSARIEPEPAGETNAAVKNGTPRGWKVTTDFDGWDNFYQSVENSFADGHTLLCFEARGDASTPQLSIECAEQDGSRWIATVELSTDLARYVLHPMDFDHWHDSAARRGGPGDRFNPASVARMHIGLSTSHTPKCQEGPHAYWIRDLATAVDPNPEQHDFHLPDVEALCPSYKLHPLVGVASVRPVHCIGFDGLEAQPADRPDVPLSIEGYSPVWRNGGMGFDRQRSWRWVRVLDAYDDTGRNRGALVSFMLGGTVFPGAIWANLGVADPACLVADGRQARVLQPVLFALAESMARGCFLVEAGSRYFSYHPGEPIELGGLVMNAGRAESSLMVSFTLTDANGETLFEKSVPLTIPSDERRQATCTWTPKDRNVSRFPYTITTQLLGTNGTELLDAVSHQIDLLPENPARPEACVKVEGSRFMLGGKPWYMLGINYYPSSQGGRTPVRILQRENYDPSLVERDLTWLESVGINTLSGVPALMPADPDAPGAYRDLQDFLQRCGRHGITVFHFLPWGNPLPRADVAAIKQYIDRAGLKDHPAILAWELAWEPIHHPLSPARPLDFLTPDWNAWIVERYGSLAEAERDWDFKLKRTSPPANQNGSTPPVAAAAIPEAQWFDTHGPWDRVTAAFRRFFSDRVGRGYGEVIRQLRQFDPNHLVTFRFGACGIPNKSWFAHAHSASVAKHVSFLCPEGYNLQTGGWATPTPADDLRQGGLVTLYYRFLAREKPVVWMEFGYTVNGFQTKWKTGMEHISPAELALQRTEYENFFKMFVESGARGAAPWWLPGGFRLGEGSDFGVLEPDGTERPVCEVLKTYFPKFAELETDSCVAPGQAAETDVKRPVIHLDFDARYADAWDFYGPQYLEAVKSGRLPLLRTAGTGTTSADCPLVAVGNTPCNGHNPPQFLNAEFNTVRIKPSAAAPWQVLRRGQTLTISRDAQVRCRAAIGNIAEAAWLAPEEDRPDEPGTVYLRCQVGASGTVVQRPIAADTPYLGDARVDEFTLPLAAEGKKTITFQMFTTRKQGSTELAIPFGEKFSVTVNVVP